MPNEDWLFCKPRLKKEPDCLLKYTDPVSPPIHMLMPSAAIHVGIISKKYKTSTALTKTLPWAYLGLSYVLFYVLPPLLFLTLAWREPLLWALVALSALSLLGASINYFFYNPKK